MYVPFTSSIRTNLGTFKSKVMFFNLDLEFYFILFFLILFRSSIFRIINV